jgi:hypothetical protein
MVETILRDVDGTVVIKCISRIQNVEVDWIELVEDMI